MLFNRFMAAMWDKWASKKTIINSNKRVGITATALDVNSMEQVWRGFKLHGWSQTVVFRKH